MWQPGWEGSLGENGYKYMYGRVPSLFTWNYCNTGNWLNPNTKWKVKSPSTKKKWLSQCPTLFSFLFFSPFLYGSQDIDECEVSSRCRHGGRCVNTHGSYECYCTLLVDHLVGDWKVYLRKPSEAVWLSEIKYVKTVTLFSCFTSLPSSGLHAC